MKKHTLIMFPLRIDNTTLIECYSSNTKITIYSHNRHIVKQHNNNVTIYVIYMYNDIYQYMYVDTYDMKYLLNSNKFLLKPKLRKHRVYF